MAKDLLLEIGTEELPSSSVYSGIEQLLKNAEKTFRKHRIDYKKINTFGSPRRIVLHIQDVEEIQSPLITKVLGPFYKDAYDKKGNPTKVAIGFAKAMGVKINELKIEKGKKGDVVVADRVEEGKETITILPQILKELISSLEFEKSMLWDYPDLRFSRPIRWTLSLFEKDLIEFSLDGIKSNRFTYGHRLYGKEPILINNCAEYFNKLKEKLVIVDQNLRRKIILDEIQKIEENDLKIRINPEVLDEVVNLVEFPQVIIGKYPEKFLELPEEILVTAMESHQRYFPVEDKNGDLTNQFIIVHNGFKENENLIREGHQEVLKARFEDASFSFYKDISIKFEERTESLKDVSFHDKLGSLYNKVRRLEIMGTYLVKINNFEDIKDNLVRSIRLCKNDLTTKMVDEFPELQGVVGKIYSALSGEGKIISESIGEHYFPIQIGDKLPESIVGSIISCVDKLDNIVGMFSINEIPTSSQDPHALRRQANGIISIISDLDFSFPLSNVIFKNYELYKKQIQKIYHPEETLELSQEETIKIVKEFILDRLKAYLVSLNQPSELFDAVICVSNEEMVDILKRESALFNSVKSGKFEDIIVPYERCYNLSKGEEFYPIDETLFSHPTESELNDLIKTTIKEIKELTNSKKYDLVLNKLSKLRPVVDRLFDDVLIMEKDVDIKRNRLSLLLLCVNTYNQFCDFSKIIHFVYKK